MTEEASAETNGTTKVLLVGATGGLGLQVLRTLRRRQDGQKYEVCCLVRSLLVGWDSLKEFEPDDQVTLIEGDLTFPSSLEPITTRPFDIVISCVGSNRVTRIPEVYFSRFRSRKHPMFVEYEGIRNLVEVFRHRQDCHPLVVLVSVMFITRPFSVPSIVLNTFLSGVCAWKLEGERVLRESGLPYLILRPGGLNSNPAAGPDAIAIEQGDRSRCMASMSREDVAATLVAATEAATHNSTLEVYLQKTEAKTEDVADLDSRVDILAARMSAVKEDQPQALDEARVHKISTQHRIAPVAMATTVLTLSALFVFKLVRKLGFFKGKSNARRH